MAALLHTRLESIAYVTKTVLSFRFRSLDGASLPAATAGSHIGVHLPNGLVRQYSLIHAGENLDAYEIGVKNEAGSRGGSCFMHGSLRVGQLIFLDMPRNNFPLVNHQGPNILIAGGIGITPILSMAEQLALAERPFRLFYAARTRDELAFLPRTAGFCSPIVHVDAEQGNAVLDIGRVVEESPAQAHLYCCGPAPMLAAFEAACRHRPPDSVHVEYFSPREAPSTSGGYTVVLARKGVELRVPPGNRLLTVLRDAGVDVPTSCEEGVCATCETRVLEGVPDHKDSILSDQERASGRTMMVCVSGSKSPRLVLDL